MKYFKTAFAALLLALTLVFSACVSTVPPKDNSIPAQNASYADDTESYVPEVSVHEVSVPEVSVPDIGKNGFSLEDIPAFSDKPYIAVNGNTPYFTENEIVADPYEFYSELDSLGRCGVTIACIGKELMPTEDRGNIGQVKPTGWHTVKYDCVDGKYLYNRCHLIGYQLTGENANVNNLVTGTRYMNVTGMLPFENMVADYIKETGNHVMYRVTPIFDGDDLLCRGVLMEAYSVEDEGEVICFNVFVYNAQPSIEIDYATGKSRLNETETDVSDTENKEKTYILNTNSKKFHHPDCSSVSKISENNKQEYTGTREALINDGYSPCGICKP